MRHSNIEHQNGNTLIGLIVGLIIGLAIALSITLYIRYAPAPFSNKNTTDPVTPLAIPMADPNKILQGKSPAEKVHMPPSELNAELLPDSQLEQAHIIEITPPKEGNEAVHKQANKNEEAKQKESQYCLQFGAHQTKEAARQHRAELMLQGLEVKISRSTVGQTLYYRVRLGPVTQYEASSMRDTLSKMDIKVLMIPC